MQKKIFISFLISCLPVVLFAQDPPLNMTLVSHLNYFELHGAQLNDCWGYVDETGIEYAIAGTTKGTSIVSLQTPANPVEIVWIPGMESTWRDIQVWDDYAYVTTEAQEGLLIIDMSAFPSPNVVTHHYSGDQVNGEWLSAHDVFIDAEGFAYICGANRGNGGMIILDVHTNPVAPVEVGVFDNWYCHDAFAQGDRLYGAHIGDGFLSVIDISDRSNPVLINTQITPNSFTHNIWVTENDQYAVTTDEIPGSFLTLYDLSDPMNIKEADRIRSSPGKNVIPHNAFILHDSLIVSSYYTDGITVHSMSRPNNLVEIASFDTYPGQNSSFNGSWGAYAFLPSGMFLATDITEGLFVVQPNLIAPAYYEGLVRDAATLLPLENAVITIENDPQTDRTAIDGEFAVGTVVPGTKNVTFFKTEYFPQTISVPFVNGQLITDTINLVKMPSFPLTVKVVEQGTNIPLIGADIRFTVPEQSVEAVTDGFGEHQFTLYYTGENYVEAGIWGHVTKCQELIIDENTGTLTIALEKGYYDDFTFDNSWESINFGADLGIWDIGVPIGSDFSCTTPVDIDFDCGNRAWVTGNGADETPKYDDVSNGKVVLRSPLFDLSGSEENWLHFSTWFHCSGGPMSPDDTLCVYLTNNLGEKVLVDASLPNMLNYDQWISKAVRVSDFIVPTPDMQLSVEVADELPGKNVTEGGFDGFFISGHNQLAVEDILAESVQIFPNPAKESLMIKGIDSDTDFTIISAEGKHILAGKISENGRIPVAGLSPGIYLLKLQDSVFRFIKE